MSIKELISRLEKIEDKDQQVLDIMTMREMLFLKVREISFLQGRVKELMEQPSSIKQLQADKTRLRKVLSKITNEYRDNSIYEGTVLIKHDKVFKMAIDELNKEY